MHLPSTSALTFAVLVPLIAWRMYARLRRMVGRQRLTKYRLWVQLSLFPALVLLVGYAAAARPMALLALAAGLAVGAGLGLYGLKTTQFQPELGNLYYTPNAHLGIALSLLFIVRIAYRLFEVYVLASTPDPTMADFGRSPLTLLAFGLLAAYYITYAIGLARWRSRVLAAKRQRIAAQAGEN